MADPVTWIAIGSTVASAASGAVSYMGAQKQAKQMEQQAHQAEILASHRAQVERNNAVAAANDEAYNQSVAKFNKAEAKQQTDQKLRQFGRERDILMASEIAKGAKRGVFNYSFSDALRSKSLQLNQQEQDIQYSGLQQGYQYDQQSSLSSLRAERSFEMGDYNSSMIKLEGAYQSSNLKAQAQSTKIGGYASLASGLGQAASTGVKAYDRYRGL